ncbi:MAG TPA: peptide deformylase [Firmicutes bacterium]|jgi:peptide deformylase|nr:peptide deformylase [Bacillota bacterium]MDK2926404.1 peptide deformylase [Bacillota bacterium]HHV57043.1 peptide deformylase [Bacillota bacterium]
MDTLKIRLYGDPVLREKAQPVDRVDAGVKRILAAMLRTMYAAEGVGLAGPQVGVLKCLVVIDVGEGPLELINPEIIAREGTQDGVEGCLSLPGLVGDVVRSEKVTVRALDARGREREIVGEGLLARALQHEIDHLDGILFVDKARNLRPAQSEGEMNEGQGGR